ncbi:MAG: glycosyltransferase family 9 protein [Bacteroidota bacterium]
MLSPRLLITIDNLLNPLYRLALLLFISFRKKHVNRGMGDQPVYAIKMMGIGSITRIYRTLKEKGADFDKVLFISLHSNRALFEALAVRNVKYINGKNLFVLMLDLVRLFFFIRRTKPASLVNYERASNFLGLFQILTVSFSRTVLSSFHDLDEDYSNENDRIYSLQNRPFQELIQLTLDNYSLLIRPPRQESSDVSIDAKKIIININASDYMPYRRYGQDQFADVIRQLHRQNPSLYFELIGSGQEKGYVQALIDEVDDEEIRLINRCGSWSIVNLMEEFRDCALFITGDSGPMHIAALINIPMITIWGPTSANHFGYNNDLVVNIETTEGCSPCFQYAKSRAARSCNKRIDCLTRLRSSRIVAAAQAILDRSETSRTVAVSSGEMGLQPDTKHSFVS